MLKVSQLYIYPIKSLGGIALSKAKVTDRGFKYDRRWMLVDTDNRFLSQREVVQMALIRVQIAPNGLLVSYTGKDGYVIVPFTPTKNEFAEVNVWDDTCTARFVSDEVDQWFSSMLEIKCRLVFMPDDSERITDQKYAPEGSITSFSDGFPFLLIGQASLDDLNSRLAEALPMDRFRPNIVFTGGAPYMEDELQTFTIGDITFNGVKLCARCVITTINQQTAIKSNEPLKTLAGYRFKNNKILFGQNLVHRGLGDIAIGQELTHFA